MKEELTCTYSHREFECTCNNNDNNNTLFLEMYFINSMLSQMDKNSKHNMLQQCREMNGKNNEYILIVRKIINVFIKL